MQEIINQHVGLDVHKKFIYAVVVDNQGDTLFEEKVPNEPKFLTKLISKINKNAMIALESCICWEHVYDNSIYIVVVLNGIAIWIRGKVPRKMISNKNKIKRRIVDNIVKNEFFGGNG